MIQSLVWFRQDLRIEDHCALWHARQQGNCIAVVILSPEQWKMHDDAQVKIDFYLRQLTVLKQQLDVLNIPLIIETIPLWQDVPLFLQHVTEQYNIHSVHANIEAGVNELKRDHAVQAILNRLDKELVLYHDRTIFPLGSIRNKSEQPYQVFGAFKKTCYERLSVALPQCFPTIESQSAALKLKSPTQIPSMSELGFEPVNTSMQTLWPVGQGIVQQQLDDFIEQQLYDYHQGRDFPAQTGTSKLSAYLNIGILSIRQCLQALFRHQQHHFIIEHQGQQTWLDELLWREFYQHLLFDYPELSRHQPFKKNTKKIVWRNAHDDFQAWTQGRTGIPIVDAGMRELTATGWMHNRVRMICAMFLSKNLLIDWRKGEQWFMQHLIDGDLAANNGGWQWSASTGTDAVPYFRVFNPISQSKKFDPDAIYLKKWLPELADLNTTEAHEPYAKNPNLNIDYPKAIVDLKQSRLRVIDVFKSL
ncbi:cryptochrome/photolyase family protein [Acinetobacter ihumii]|uniref:cryptochrome/photolyase family protein n=1 Tax=Acinetobacter ihumii TaxID=2483802 RepID=UPI00148EA2CE|nr:deoxyribodipyrimidine photo-lyase [Acinetobacter ihumii]